MATTNFPPPASRPATLPQSPVKTMVAVLAGIILSCLFLASGLWKLSDLDATAQRVTQLLVPPAMSMFTAMLVAAAETLAGILLLMPSCRRWGAWIAAALLAGFMCYFAVFYTRLLGDDCSCFPWIRRVVGPGFFVGDAAMLALALLAGYWSTSSKGRRTALAASCVVVLLVGASYAMATTRRGQFHIPETAVVDGTPIPLRQGRVLLYFFDPQCSHCEAVAKIMGKWNWGATRVVAVPTAEVRFARSFLDDTGLRADICTDAPGLKVVFPFVNPPHAVAINQGRVMGVFNFNQFEGEEFSTAMMGAGFIR